MNISFILMIMPMKTWIVIMNMSRYSDAGRENRTGEVMRTERLQDAFVVLKRRVKT